MKEDLLADLWSVVVEHIPEKKRADVATDFVNTLMDYGIKEATLDALLGVDTYLDNAIDYVVDGKAVEEEEEEDDDYDKDED
jgi:hypothetical protein